MDDNELKYAAWLRPEEIELQPNNYSLTNEMMNLFKDGKFVESELGLIPEGWRVGKAEDFYTINIGKTPPRAERQWFSETKGNNKIWISISDMGSCGAYISDSKEYLTPEAQREFNVVMVPAGTILLSFKSECT